MSDSLSAHAHLVQTYSPIRESLASDFKNSSWINSSDRKVGTAYPQCETAATRILHLEVPARAAQERIDEQRREVQEDCKDE